MELKDDRTATPSDGQYDCDVAKQRPPVMRRVHDGDVELEALQGTVHGINVSKSLRQLLQERLLDAAGSPRVRDDRTPARPEGFYQMGCVLHDRPAHLRMRDQHEDAELRRIRIAVPGSARTERRLRRGTRRRHVPPP